MSHWSSLVDALAEWVRPAASPSPETWHLRKGEAIPQTLNPPSTSKRSTRPRSSSDISTMLVFQTLRSSISRMPSSLHTARACSRSSLISSVMTPMRDMHAPSQGSLPDPFIAGRALPLPFAAFPAHGFSSALLIFGIPCCWRVANIPEVAPVVRADAGESVSRHKQTNQNSSQHSGQEESVKDSDAGAGSPSPALSGPRRALASLQDNPRFRLLWLSNLFFFGGAWTQTLVLGWLVYETTGSEFLLSLFTAIRVAPLL